MVLNIASFNPPANIPFPIIFFRLFLGLPFLEPLTTKFFLFTFCLFCGEDRGTFSSSILSSYSGHYLSTCLTQTVYILSRAPLSSPHLLFHELLYNLCHFIVFYHRSYVAFLYNFFFHLSSKASTRHQNIRHFFNIFYTCFLSASIT